MNEAEQGVSAPLGLRSAAAPESEKDRRIRQWSEPWGGSRWRSKSLKNVVGECAAVKFIPRGRSCWYRVTQRPWSPHGVVATTKRMALCETQTRTARDERTRLAGARAPSAGAAEERMGLRGSSKPNQIWQS